MGLKLCRVPGRTLVANFEIVHQPDELELVFDPNSFYGTLGLSPSRTHTPDQIKKAYWKLAKLYHPDGASPNADEFRRVQTAYLVLSDPDNREKYDVLDSSQMWLDEDVIAAIIKNILPKDLKDRKKTIEALKHEITWNDIGGYIKKAIPAPPKPTYDALAYYYYEGEEVPDQDVRDKWVEFLLIEMFNRRLAGEVRLGFTTQRSHVLAKPWGEVLMVSGDPSIESVSNILDCSEFTSHSDP